MYKLIYLMLFLTLSKHIYGQEIVVESVGIGKSQIEAEKNAILSAVDKAIGSVVNSKILIINENIIKRKIISYSDGYVKSWRTIEGPQIGRDGGAKLFWIKIEAKIQKNKLLHNLSQIDKRLLKTKIEGPSLFGEAISKENSLQNGIELIKDALRGAPDKLLTARISGQRLLTTGDPTRLELQFEVAYDHEKYYKYFLPSLLKALNSISNKKKDFVFKKKYNPNSKKRYIGLAEYRKIRKLLEPIGRQKIFYVAVSAKSDKKGYEVHFLIYEVPANFIQVFQIWKRYSPHLILKLFDGEGNIVKSKKVIRSGWRYSMVKSVKDHYGIIYILPFVNLVHTVDTRGLWFGEKRTLKEKFVISRYDLRRIKKSEFLFVPANE
ncbi:hypothetical protein ACFL35_10565 [Candidatus Riflebacteria bacterium]